MLERIGLCSGCVRENCSEGFRTSEQGPKTGRCFNKKIEGETVVPDQPVPFALRTPEPMTRFPGPADIRSKLGLV